MFSNFWVLIEINTCLYKNVKLEVSVLNILFQQARKNERIHRVAVG